MGVPCKATPKEYQLQESLPRRFGRCFSCIGVSLDGTCVSLDGTSFNSHQGSQESEYWFASKSGGSLWMGEKGLGGPNVV